MRNLLEALAQILASFKDRDGRIIVPGFYDGVRAIGPAERADVAALPFDVATEAKTLGVPELAGEAGYAPLERMWMRPTLEINGMYGGYQGPGGKTIVPSSVAKVRPFPCCRARFSSTWKAVVAALTSAPDRRARPRARRATPPDTTAGPLRTHRRGP